MIRQKKHVSARFTSACIAFVAAGLSTFDVFSQEIDRLTVFSGELRRSINNSGTVASQASQDLNNAATSAPQQLDIGTVPLPETVQTRAQAASPAPRVFNPLSDEQLPQQNIPAQSVQSGTSVIDDADPFAPTGFRIGTFEGNALLEQSLGYSSNVSQNAGGAGGGFSQTDAQLGLVSNWSLHELRLDLNASYRRPFSGSEIDQPQMDVTAAHRLDLRDGFTLTTSGFYDLATQEFTDTILAPGAIDTPIVENYGGSLELERTDRKLQFALRGGISVSSFEDADLGGGTVGFQGDLDNAEYELGLRLGYETSPALTPFVETVIARQNFDLSVDRNGNQRDNDRFEMRAGVEIDLGEKLQGDIAFGYVTRSFEDPLLADLDGFTLNGSLNWSPERDTQIGLQLSTQTNNSIAANENGSIIYSVGLTAERQITDRLSANSRFDYQTETNDDRNTNLGLGVGILYWVNRFMAFTANADYDRFSSDAANADFDEFSLRTGVRFQR